jgi:hypothetical protein
MIALYLFAMFAGAAIIGCAITAAFEVAGFFHE